jgi:glycosyltransferase involved in cell wall biosynthesis
VIDGWVSEKIMNICIVTQQYKNVISGVGLHANNLTKALLDAGHTITLLLPEDQSPQVAKQGLTVVKVNNPRFNQNQARWVSLSFSFNAALRKLESQNKFDLIHFTDARESFFCKTRAPMIGHVNDTYSAELKGPLEYKKNYPDWLVRWLYYSVVHFLESRRLQRLKLVVTNSQFTANTIKKTYPKAASRVRLCYKSVDMERYREIFKKREETPTDPERQVILFVGSNMIRKGVPDLIRSAPGVIKEHPKARFVIVGNDKSVDNLKVLCSDLKVDQKFEFAGWRSQADLLDYYRQATLFIMPSLTEALGVTFLEAMAAGVPVIGTNVGGIPEIIRHGVNGLLIPAESPSSVAEAINRMLADRQLRQSLANNAHNTLNKFDVTSMMECTFRLYREIVNSETFNPEVS